MLFLVASIFRGPVQGDPAPYEEFLGGLRILKTDQEARLRLTEDRWLDRTLKS